MTPRARGNLRLGSRVVELLIPHRRPFLMVDGIDAFHPSDPPRIVAHRSVAMNEPWFEGHFPGMPVWPGALTMEGLGQTGTLLMALTTACAHARERGEDDEHVLEGLRNLDRGYRMHPGHRPGEVEGVLETLRSCPAQLALGAGVDLKFLAPVFPGCRLHYEVELTDRIGDRVRFSAEATVEETTVARGSITGALVPRPTLLDAQ